MRLPAKYTPPTTAADTTVANKRMASSGGPLRAALRPGIGIGIGIGAAMGGTIGAAWP